MQKIWGLPSTLHISSLDACFMCYCHWLFHLELLWWSTVHPFDLLFLDFIKYTWFSHVLLAWRHNPFERIIFSRSNELLSVVLLLILHTLGALCVILIVVGNKDDAWENVEKQSSSDWHKKNFRPHVRGSIGCGQTLITFYFKFQENPLGPAGPSWPHENLMKKTCQIKRQWSPLKKRGW